MNKDIKQLSFIYGFILAVLFGAWLWLHIYTNSGLKAAHASSFVCPDGTYEIEPGVCKNEPTGCPFGDSVPLDKCMPPSDIQCNADWTVCEPKTIAHEEQIQSDAYALSISYGGK